MSCAQIEVTGGGDATPKTVSFPGAYTRKSHPPVLSFNAVFSLSNNLS